MRVHHADCVIALSFGKVSCKTDIDINEEVAKIASSFELPIIAQEEVALHCKTTEVISSVDATYIDTWGVLSKAKVIMNKKGYKKAVLVSHKVHAKRMQKQAEKVGINIVVSTLLPSEWDKHSRQWWTRSSWQWAIHEILTIPYLKIVNRL